MKPMVQKYLQMKFVNCGEMKDIFKNNQGLKIYLHLQTNMIKNIKNKDLN